MFRSCIGVKRCLWYPFQLVERVVEISLCGPSVLYSCSGKENSNHSCCRCDLLSPWGSYLRCDVTCSNLLYCSWILISMLYKCTLPLEPAQLKLEVALFIVLTRHVNYNTMYLWWPTHNLSLKSVPKIRYPRVKWTQRKHQILETAGERRSICNIVGALTRTSCLQRKSLLKDLKMGNRTVAKSQVPILKCLLRNSASSCYCPSHAAIETRSPDFLPNRESWYLRKSAMSRQSKSAPCPTRPTQRKEQE